MPIAGAGAILRDRAPAAHQGRRLEMGAHRGSVVERDRDGRPLRISGTHIDLTDRKRAEAERLRLLEIIEATTDYIATMDLEGRTIFANATLLRLRGHPNLAAARGRPLSDYHPTGPFACCSVTPFPRPGPEHLARRDPRCSTGRAGSFPFPSCCWSIATPAASRRFCRPSSATSRGRKGGGRPHGDRAQDAPGPETREPWGSRGGMRTISIFAHGHARQCQSRPDRLPDSSPVHHSLQQIEQAAVRAAELCKEMLAYSGRSQFVATRLDLSALVEDTTQLLQVSNQQKVRLKLELHRPLPAILADPTRSVRSS